MWVSKLQVLSVTAANQTSSQNYKIPVYTYCPDENILTVYVLNNEMTCMLVPVVLLLECISMLIKPQFAQATVYFWVNAQFSQQRSIMLLLYKHFTPFIALPTTITLQDGRFDMLLIACFPVPAPNLFSSQLSGTNNRCNCLRGYEFCYPLLSASLSLVLGLFWHENTHYLLFLLPKHIEQNEIKKYISQYRSRPSLERASSRKVLRRCKLKYLFTNECKKKLFRQDSWS